MLCADAVAQTGCAVNAGFGTAGTATDKVTACASAVLEKEAEKDYGDNDHGDEKYDS